METMLSFFKGLGLGALGMYFFDPAEGGKRRERIREKVTQSLPGMKMKGQEELPTAQLLLGAAGVGLVLSALTRPGLTRTVVGLLGVGLVAQAVQRTDLSKLIPAGSSRGERGERRGGKQSEKSGSRARAKV
jgi:hypothetical protein